MLMPRKVKHRKVQRGRLTGQAKAVPRSLSATTVSRPSSPDGSPPARSKPPVSR